MANKKKNKKNTTLVSNPASRITVNEVKENGQKKSGSRKTKNKKNAAGQGQKKARRYRRNSGGTSLISVVLSSAVGALIINLFDAAINRIAPSTSAGYRTLSKGVIGMGLLLFGNKLPWGRKYAPVVGGAFVFATALDLVSTYAMPKILGLLPEQLQPKQPEVIGTATDKTTGQLGTAIKMPNGDTAEVYIQRARPQQQQQQQNQLGAYRGAPITRSTGYGSRQPALV